MSKATKRKHVTKEVLDDYYVPENNEEIAKILGGRGNNLHEVECVEGRRFLVSMPSKFRKNVWIKRGDFVVVAPISEGNKVQAEIVYVLYAKQIKYLRDEGLWPAEFDSETNGIPDNINGEKPKEHNGSDSDDDGLLMENPNRPKFVYYMEDESATDNSSDENVDDQNEE